MAEPLDPVEALRSTLETIGRAAANLADSDQDRDWPSELRAIARHANAALAALPAPECLNPACHNGMVAVTPGVGGDGFDRCPDCSAAPVPEGVPEDRIVPEGWRVAWTPAVGTAPAIPRLVPLSDTPHEAEGEQP